MLNYRWHVKKSVTLTFLATVGASRHIIDLIGIWLLFAILSFIPLFLKLPRHSEFIETFNGTTLTMQVLFMLFRR